MDDFVPDDDFQPDSPEQQGKIENTESLLHRAIGTIASGPNSIGSLISQKYPVEDYIVPATQMGVGIATKNPLLTTMATTGAEGLRQFAKAQRGQPYDVTQPSRTAMITAGTELIPNALFKGMFREEIANQTLKKGPGLVLGRMKERLSQLSQNNPEIGIPLNQVLGILKPVQQELEYVPGQIRTNLNRIATTLTKKFGGKFGANIVPAGELVKIEDTLNAFTKIPREELVKSGVGRLAQKALPEARRGISRQVEQSASQAGIEGFGETSREVSGLMRKASSKFNPLIRFISGLPIGMAVGGLAENALPAAALGAGSFAATQALQNPTVRKSIFDLLSSILGRGVTSGIKTGIGSLLRN